MCSAATVNRFKPAGWPRKFLLQLSSDLTSILTVFLINLIETKTTVIIERVWYVLKYFFFFAVTQSCKCWRSFAETTSLYNTSCIVRHYKQIKTKKKKHDLINLFISISIINEYYLSRFNSSGFCVINLISIDHLALTTEVHRRRRTLHPYDTKSSVSA